MNEPFILFSVSLWSRSEKKSEEQFKQIVLSTEFEFYWAKLSWKLTELRGRREQRENYWNLFIAFLKLRGWIFQVNFYRVIRKLLKMGGGKIIEVENLQIGMSAQIWSHVIISI